ncbi:MAG: YfcE family phosphodiesterase [Firmicutes bacterium]|nr:YfcE family phosphodiesterase [Bacillota bacterium]
MLKILVISDTHFPHKKIPGNFYDILTDNLGNIIYDGIIHCGDIQEIDFYEELLSLNIPIYAVLGNNYDFSLQRILPLRRIIFLEDITIGIVHGNGSSAKTILNAQKEFSGEKVDIVCFGHSHIASIEKKREKIYFNPGSLTSSRSTSNSYGVIEIDGYNLKTYIKEF